MSGPPKDAPAPRVHGGEPDVAVTKALIQDDGNRALVRQFRLYVTAGPDAPATFIYNGRSAVIGKHRSADMLLSDTAVSRLHAEIMIREHRVMIRDLGSRNGTLVDGVPVESAYLLDGALISIGKSQLKFELGVGHVEVPLSKEENFGRLAGRSVAMRAVFATLERVAQSDVTVLLEGETGTGKELAAESIHLASKRRDGPFVVIDCGAIPSQLLESELFGHERGAFTGAVAARDGSFAAADGGTLFLDEIGELSTDLQPKLLRVLERRQIRRVGGSGYQSIDVRIIAATNRNLVRETNTRRFRSDLYYRLAVLQVRMPPLRERNEDLTLLVERILDDLGATAEDRELALAPNFIADLARHSWPGNVRELRNHLERCMALSEAVPYDHAIAGMGVAANLVDATLPLREARDKWSSQLERRYLTELIALHDDNVSAAARAAGIGRVYLYRLLWKHGIR